MRSHYAIPCLSWFWTRVKLVMAWHGERRSKETQLCFSMGRAASARGSGQGLTWDMSVGSWTVTCMIAWWINTTWIETVWLVADVHYMINQKRPTIDIKCDDVLWLHLWFSSDLLVDECFRGQILGLGLGSYHHKAVVVVHELWASKKTSKITQMGTRFPCFWWFNL